MRRSIDDIQGYSVSARTGDDLGKVSSFLFDDDSWTVRYLTVDTGGWLSEQLVIVDPSAVDIAAAAGRDLRLDLTKEQVEASPSIDADAPVSRQKMTDLHEHYGWPMWWAADMQGTVMPPILPPGTSGSESAEESASVLVAERGDSNLRSTAEVMGYQVEAADGSIGHVEDFVVDDEAWVLRYVVVDTRDWLPGKHVLVAVPWIRDIDWSARVVRFDLEKESIEESPPFDPEAGVNREYEERLYDYYGRPRYWA